MALVLLGIPLFPSCGGFYDSEGHQAEPEVHNQPQVSFSWVMLRGWGHVGHKEKINRVPRQHGDQGMDEVAHTLLRHRANLLQRT
jgi:hypothetical protein